MKPITNKNQYETGTRNSYLIITATPKQGQNQRMADGENLSLGAICCESMKLAVIDGKR